MLISKEQQEAWINNYAKNHSNDEVLGFIDGINKALEAVEKGMNPLKEVKILESLTGKKVLFKEINLKQSHALHKKYDENYDNKFAESTTNDIVSELEEKLDVLTNLYFASQSQEFRTKFKDLMSTWEFKGDDSVGLPPASVEDWASDPEQLDYLKADIEELIELTGTPYEELKKTKPNYSFGESSTSKKVKLKEGHYVELVVWLKPLTLKSNNGMIQVKQGETWEFERTPFTYFAVKRTGSDKTAVSLDNYVEDIDYKYEEVKRAG